MEKEYIKKIISYFANKYKYHWQDIYEAIESKEPINKEQINNYVSKENEITIIDDDYPNNFKNIYMPPLVIYYKGNRALLNEDKKITSLWSNWNYQEVINNLDKELIYAVELNEKRLNDIKKLNELGFKLIIIANTYNHEWLETLTFNENTIFISEADLHCKNPKFDTEQNIERIILGISNKALMLNKSINDLNYLLPLFSFEKRPFLVLNKNEYSADEIHKYNIQKFNDAWK